MLTAERDHIMSSTLGHIISNKGQSLGNRDTETFTRVTRYCPQEEYDMNFHNFLGHLVHCNTWHHCLVPSYPGCSEDYEEDKDCWLLRFLGVLGG